MSAHTDHTASLSVPQLTLACQSDWEREIVPSLPPELLAQAHALGAFQRLRALSSPTDLLRGLLAYVLCARSFRQLGAWGVLSAVADLSDTAWRKRLRLANAWLLWLLTELLSSQPPRSWLSQRLRGRVWLVDATTFGQSGGCGDQWRVHLGYDLLAARMRQAHLTDRSQAETLEHLTFQPGDVVVADGGYGYRKMVACAQRQGADVVLRILPSTFPLERSLGRPLDLVSLLRQPGPSLRSITGYAVWQQQRYRVRVVAVRVSETQQRAAAERARRKAVQRGRQPSETRLFLSKWMLLLTTLSEDSWTAAEIVALYRARWQVEVLFKRIKQLLRVQQVQARSVATAEATLRAVLVAWALQERTSTLVQEALRASGQAVQEEVGQWRWSRDDEMSLWGLATLSIEVLRQQVRGSWSEQHLQASVPRLRRFLLNRPRRRGHQASQTWAWLTAVCFTPLPPHLDATS